MTRIRELANDVRARRTGAHELVAESLRRIESLDPDLGAVVALRVEEALHEARGLDARLAGGGEAGPLAGLSLLVKDITDVAGIIQLRVLADPFPLRKERKSNGPGQTTRAVRSWHAGRMQGGRVSAGFVRRTSVSAERSRGCGVRVSSAWAQSAIEASVGRVGGVAAVTP